MVLLHSGQMEKMQHTKCWQHVEVAVCFEAFILLVPIWSVGIGMLAPWGLFLAGWAPLAVSIHNSLSMTNVAPGLGVFAHTCFPPYSPQSCPPEKTLADSHSKTGWTKALWLSISWNQTQLLREPQQGPSMAILSYFWRDPRIKGKWGCNGLYNSFSK